MRFVNPSCLRLTPSAIGLISGFRFRSSCVIRSPHVSQLVILLLIIQFTSSSTNKILLISLFRLIFRTVRCVGGVFFLEPPAFSRLLFGFGHVSHTLIHLPVLLKPRIIVFSINTRGTKYRLFPILTRIRVFFS